MATQKATHSSPYRRTSVPEGVRYSPSAAQDLLQGTNEWGDVQDIVKMTFKALFDVVKAQGEALRELEVAIPTKASKAELNTGLSQKPNITDVSRTLAELAASIETRATFEDVQRIVATKSDRGEVDRDLADLKRGLDSKLSSAEVNAELERVFVSLDSLQQDLQHKFSTLCALFLLFLLLCCMLL